LQRIYGISFPDKKQMTEHKALLAEAAKRDHRKIGKVISVIQRQLTNRNKNYFSSTSFLQAVVSSFLTE
jgi:threonyl-tRNA synthetase